MVTVGLPRDMPCHPCHRATRVVTYRMVERSSLPENLSLEPATRVIEETTNNDKSGPPRRRTPSTQLKRATCPRPPVAFLAEDDTRLQARLPDSRVAPPAIAPKWQILLSGLRGVRTRTNSGFARSMCRCGRYAEPDRRNMRPRASLRTEAALRRSLVDALRDLSLLER
jgi:hypothetical protein